MPHQILMIDMHADHYRVMRRFIERVHPNAQLSEYDPSVLNMPGPKFKWADYDLLFIDNELGEIDGIDWLKSASQAEHFPPFIVVSSTQETDTPAAMEAVIRSIRMGAINYLFKKNIRLEQLNENITKVLAKVPERAGGKQGMDTGQLAVREVQEAVDDTQHEIHLAMAMLDGHTEWPFTMQDILTGKAFIGDYKVVSYLGSEISGATFKVKHKNLEQPQVMYFILCCQNKDGSLPAHLRHELEVMKKIRHPNLLPIKDYQLQGNAILVVRDLIESETLEQKLKTHGVHTKQAINLFRQIISSLEALHKNKIHVGRFTPRSLRVDADDRLVLTDTGLLQRLQAIKEGVSSGVIKESPIYATPEQVQGRALDQRTDIYIAGLIGFEMMAGVPVYAKGSIKDICYAHVMDPIPNLPDKNNPLNELFHKMLQKTPSKRIQNTDLVITMLDMMTKSVA